MMLNGWLHYGGDWAFPLFLPALYATTLPEKQVKCVENFSAPIATMPWAALEAP